MNGWSAAQACKPLRCESDGGDTIEAVGPIAAFGRARGRA